MPTHFTFILIRSFESISSRKSRMFPFCFCSLSACNFPYNKVIGLLNQIDRMDWSTKKNKKTKICEIFFIIVHFRDIIVRFYLSNSFSLLHTCSIFGCSKTSLLRWIHRFLSDNSIRRYNRPSISLKITLPQVKLALSLLDQNQQIKIIMKSVSEEGIICQWKKVHFKSSLV